MNLVPRDRDDLDFRTLADATPALVWITNGDGELVYFNARWFEFTGQTPEEALGHGWTDMLHPDDLARILPYWQRCQRTGETYFSDCRYRRHDGQFRWHTFRALPHRGPGGTIERWYGVSFDIHDARTTQDRLHLALTGARAGVWEWNLRTQEVTWSPELHTLIGSDADTYEVSPSAFLSFIHSEDIESTLAQFHAAAEVGGSFELEFRVHRIDNGEIVWVSSVGRVDRDHEGVPTYARGINQDITARKEAEAAVRESEERFRNMADHAPVMVWVTDADAVCTFLSESWYEFTGQTPETGLGFGWLDAVHPEDRERSGQVFLDAVKRQEAFRLDYRLRNQNGEYRWAIDSAKPRFGAGGEYLGYIGSVFDITERKQTEESLRESEARLSLALSMAELGTFDIDLATDSVLVNERGRAIYGWAPDAPLTFAYVQSFFHPEDRDRVVRTVGEALAPGGGGEFEVEQRIIRSDGEERWIRVRGRAVVVNDVAVRCIGIYADTTEARRAAAALQATNEELERRVEQRTAELLARNEELQGFTHSVSHDLRAPLRAIVANARFAMEDEADRLSPSGRQLLDRLASAALKMGELVDDLLEYARLGGRIVRGEWVDLSELTHRVASDVARDHPEAGLTVRVQPGLEVEGDSRLLGMAMHNLIDNACKYRKKEMDAFVEVGRSDQAFFVRDQGIGLDMAYAHKLFRPFERLHREDEYAGTGIGLANVRRAIERHGGRVWAEGVPGQGTTFWFTIGD